MKKLFNTTLIITALCAACSHKETNSSTTENAPNASQTQQGTIAPAEDQGPLSAQAVMKAAKKQKVKGVVHFTRSGDNLKVEAMLEGLKPGPHGFHVHEKGDCSAPDFSSAGGHFNPTNTPHGDHTSAQKHVGDMGNIVANAKGQAKLTLELTGTTLGHTNGLLGKAVIVHEKADDFKTQPTGNSGGRIACGVIEAIR